MSTCAGVTKKGEPCMKTAKDHGYCRQHQGQVQETYMALLTEAPPAEEVGTSGHGRSNDPRRVDRLRVSRRTKKRYNATHQFTGRFSKPASLAHARKRPRGIDLAVKNSLAQYRAWRSQKVH